MRALTTDTYTDGWPADERRTDARLVTLAAESAARLERVCADWPAGRIHALAFQVALAKLKGELSAEALERLRARYERHQAEFTARLAALDMS